MKRATWLKKRLDEIPAYTLFLYNMLIDPTLPEEFKAHAFAALRYLFHDEPLDLIPEDDELLCKVDDLTMVLCCLTELTVFLPKDRLDAGVRALRMDGILVFDVVRDTPGFLGNFFQKLYALYHELKDKHRPQLGDALAKGELIAKTRTFLQSYKKPAWSKDDMQRVERFLDAFEKATGRQPPPRR